MTGTNLNFENPQALVEWVSDVPSFRDLVVIQRARSTFIDTIACTLAAAHHDTTAKIFNSMKLSGGGLCSVVGLLQTLAAGAAALVNAAAAHALDDNFL